MCLFPRVALGDKPAAIAAAEKRPASAAFLADNDAVASSAAATLAPLPPREDRRLDDRPFAPPEGESLPLLLLLLLGAVSTEINPERANCEIPIAAGFVNT